MTDTTLGYLLVALGIVFVLVLVFVATTRDARDPRRGRGVADGTEVAVVERAHPPAGVHLPPPSWLPVLMALAGCVLAAGLIFTPWALVPGFAVLLLGAFGWYRAANREWRGVAGEDGHEGRTHE